MSTNTTYALASYIVDASPQDLPTEVRKEAARTFLNWIGYAVGGSCYETPNIAPSALGPFFGAGVASVLGRSERLDPLHAALMNGIGSHTVDLMTRTYGLSFIRPLQLQMRCRFMRNISQFLASSSLARSRLVSKIFV
jgi:hypothetical protein